jgi:hypothetical protein
VARWEPLPDTVDGSMRRFVTQLRRMKDLSGLSVPALAVRTARATQAWEEYLAGVRLPPLDAVEVLAQLSGADHRRVRALYLAAERGDPDPGGRVDGWRGALRRPWGPRGRHRRRAVLTAFAAGLLPTAAVAVLMATGMTTEGTGFTPAPGSGRVAASGTPGAITPGAAPDRTATHRPAVAAPGPAGGGTSRAAHARHPGDAPSTDDAAVDSGTGSTPGTGHGGATAPDPGTTRRAGAAPSAGSSARGSGSGGAQASGGASGDAGGPVGGGSSTGGAASSGGGGAADPGQSPGPTPTPGAGSGSGSPGSGGGEPVCVRLLSVRVCL